ncbi:MAG: RdgB/HAM1 family non-canonical purine NTP pyrophosphatase [Anaerolineae bacterium]
MLEIVIGTTNPGKLREFRTLLEDLPVTLLSLEDAGLAGMDVEETGSTFAENARIKAEAYARASGKHALADDSGLCVAALDGAPGLYSARYGDPGLDDQGRRLKLLNALQDVTAREAHFECVITLMAPDGTEITQAAGRVDGHIMQDDQDGPQGFGYDAIFQPEGHNVSFAQLPKDEKNRISHRGRAAVIFKQNLAVWLATRS